MQNGQNDVAIVYVLRLFSLKTRIFSHVIGICGHCLRITKCGQRLISLPKKG